MTVVVFGSLNMDHIVYVERFPLPGETVLAVSSQSALGGKGANQAVAAARLGSSTRLIGFVGEDNHGQALTALLSQEGVDTSHVAVLVGERTGVAHVMVDRQGENTIAVTSGANRPGQTVWHPDPAPPPSVVLVQFEVSLNLTARFLREQESALFKILNAAPFIADGAELFDLANVIVVNETELAGYIGVDEVEEGEALTAAARSLITSDGQWVIVTCGGAGALAVSRDATIRTAAPKVAAIDTTGAGDCFAGALAAALDAGASMQDALVRATVAASLSVQRAGAALSMPRLNELESHLAPSTTRIAQ